MPFISPDFIEYFIAILSFLVGKQISVFLNCSHCGEYKLPEDFSLFARD